MIETRRIYIFKEQGWEEKGFDIPIYRFVPFEFVLQSIEESELFIPNIEVWKDPYEHFLANSEAYIGNARVSYKYWIPYIYGLCWTMKKESDALWRIYSPNCESVRIKTTVLKLAQASENEKDYESNSTRIIKIRPVRYMNLKEINRWIQNEIIQKKIMNDQSFIESLFIKRKEFEHEQEVRIVIQKNASIEEGKSQFSVSLLINPNTFIEEITFDPRIKSSKFNLYKKLLDQIGYIGNTSKSKLYDFDPFRIKM